MHINSGSDNRHDTRSYKECYQSMSRTHGRHTHEHSIVGQQEKKTPNGIMY